MHNKPTTTWQETTNDRGRACVSTFTVMSGGDELRARSPSPTQAMRARAERNRVRARALRGARVLPPPPPPAAGGFLPEETPPPPRASRLAAPRLDPAERPACLECERPIALSYLLDTFQHPVCDECRDADGAHSLMTRTEAKASYLLQDCDLDGRGDADAALACVRRRNPHLARGDMRLYLRAQVEARALAVWGAEERLQAELARREAARAAASARRDARRLRALRMDVRSSAWRAPRTRHEHAFGAETYDAAADRYSRACACGHIETYEKM